MKRAGESLQLPLLLRVSAPNAVTRTIGVLVDTGAQISLVKRGLFEMRPVRRKLRFTSADGSAIQSWYSVQTLSLDLVPLDSKGTESGRMVGALKLARHLHRRLERSTWSKTSGRPTSERT